MTVYSDFIEVTIDGTDVSDYVITYQRNESLCEPGQMFTLTMTRKKPDDSFLDIGVADSVVINEKYGGSPDTVLKGFVTKVEINAEKALMTVHGSDKYIMLADYFIPERLETSGQTVAYWIEYICNEAGLNVQFDVTPYAVTQGAGDTEGTPLGMQSALEALKTLERKGTCYTRYDSDADKILVYRLTTSQPKININSSNLISLDKQDAAKSTRNVVKVWGGYRYDWLTGQEVSYNTSATANIPELVVDQTTVVANPEIRTHTFANIVAQRILASTADLDDIAICECAGLYPSVDMGDWVDISISQGEFSYTRERQITSKNISVDTSGAKTSFTVGEKCPRVSVSPPPVPIYVTDTINGVGVSWDAGEAFGPSNTGLTTSGELHGKSIAVNNYGRQFVVTAAGLHKRWSGLSTWVDVTNLPDPTNESNDPSPLGVTNLEMIKVVDEPLKPYTFHMIASGGHPSGWYRSYVYSTKDYGYTWNTTQMWVPALSGGLADPYYQEHPMAPSGKVYDVWTHDMTSSLGNAVTVLVSSPYAPFVEEPPISIYILAQGLSQDQFRVYDWDGTNTSSWPNLQTQQTLSKFIRQGQLFTYEGTEDRDICYVGVNSTDGNAWPTYYGSHSWLYRTNDGGSTWANVHDNALLDTTTDSPVAHAGGIAFDTTSNEDEVRCVVWQVDYTTWTSTMTVYAHFISHDPSTGSASYNEVSQAFTLDQGAGLLTGNEYFNGYFKPTTSTNHYSARHTRGGGFAFGCIALNGRIRDPGPPVTVTGTIINEFVFKFDFATETISELCQYVFRSSSTSIITSFSLGASVNSDSVWGFGQAVGYNAFIYDSTGRTGSGIDTFDWNYKLDDDNTDKGGYKGTYPNFDLVYLDGSTESLGDFYPRPNGNWLSQRYMPFENEFEGAETYYGNADSALGSDPDGFVSTTDGYNFTQYWADGSTSPRVSTIMLEFDFRAF